MTHDVAMLWEALGAIAPRALREARVELHWAAQAVERVGKSLLREAPDHRHIALRWNAEHGALASAKVGDGWRAALELAEARLLILDPWNEVEGRLPLAGRGLQEAAAWVRENISARVESSREWAEVRTTGLPPSRIADGAAFSDPGEAHAELGRWYAAAAGVLAEIAACDDPFGPLLCWPHHFDFATRADFEPGADPETARTIVAGFSPGDAAIREPYFYVLAWPDPEPDDLARHGLEGGGTWETESFVGARLIASDLTSLAPDARASAASAFLHSGLRAAKDLLHL